MAPVLSFDINALVGAVPDGTDVSSSLGADSAIRWYAATLESGLRAIRSPVTAESTSNAGFRAEANTNANARTEDYYAYRIQCRAVKTGTVTPRVAASIFRFSSTSGNPRFNYHLCPEHWAVSCSLSGGTSYNWLEITSGTASYGLPYGTDIELVWLFKRDPSVASNQFWGVYANGLLLSSADSLGTIPTFDYTGRLFEGVYDANVQFWVHGLLEVFSTDDPLGDGVIRQVATDKKIIQIPPPSSGVATLGLSISESGTSSVYLNSNASSRGVIQLAEDGVEITGGLGSTEVATYSSPGGVIDFDPISGYMHATITAIATDSALDYTIAAFTEGGSEIAAVFFEASAPELFYRVDGGPFNSLANSGFDPTKFHTIRFSKSITGEIAILIKEDEPAGNGWSVIDTSTHLTPIASIKTTRGSALVSQVSYRGIVQFEQRAFAGVYTDSWTAGNASAGPVTQQSNHFAIYHRGARVAERVPGIVDPNFIYGLGEVWATEASGAMEFGTQGTSIEDWQTKFPTLPDAVRGSTAFVGISCMNTMVQKQVEIDAGGASFTIAVADTVALYVDVITRLVAHKNYVIFVGFLAPPTDIHSEAQGEFNIAVTAGVLAALPTITVPSLSRLIATDPRATAILDGVDPKTDYTWDTSQLHLSAADDGNNVVYAIEGAVRYMGSSAISAIQFYRRRRRR